MPLTKAGVEKIEKVLKAQGNVLHVTNFNIEMEREYRDSNYFIHIPCNQIVANKLDKFFKIVMKHKTNVLDVYIHEWPHPAWMPETAGTYGGFINVIVETPTDDFLVEIVHKLPMVSTASTRAARIADFKW
jgi:hypothetical protein